VTGLVLLAVLAAAAAVALLVRPRPSPPPSTSSPVPGEAGPDVGWLRRHRAVWALLAGVGALTVVGGAGGVVAAPVAAVGVWLVAGRAETPESRRWREEVRRDLPAVVTLVAAALRAGAPPGEAVVVVARALPGPAADRLGPVAARLSLGVAATTVWDELAADPELGPLGRTMARASTTGAPVLVAVERLADDLARSARGEVEDRARAVGVKAAVPLGLCLLPSFVLIGIVPLVAGLLGSLAL
jgi:Flp pilus assembly protein TadB